MHDLFRQSTMLWGFSVIVLIFLITGCEDDGLTSGESILTGFAIFPDSVGGGPVANSRVQIFDLTRVNDPPIEAGTTDANGKYTVVFPRTINTLAIAVVGIIGGAEVLVSGLTTPDKLAVAKEFNATTTIACEAGFDAVADGSLTPAQLDAKRISNLEQASTLFINTTNYFDLNGSVIPNARRVRQITADGVLPAIAGTWSLTLSTNSNTCEPGRVATETFATAFTQTGSDIRFTDNRGNLFTGVFNPDGSFTLTTRFMVGPTVINETLTGTVNPAVTTMNGTFNGTGSNGCTLTGTFTGIRVPN